MKPGSEPCLADLPCMNSGWKRIVSWLIVAAGVMGVVLSYWAIWVLVAYFAAGLVWFAGVALLVSGPISGVGAALACREPRQNTAMTFGILGHAWWVLRWGLCFAVLCFRFGGEHPHHSISIESTI